ncbi:MAG: hypothetical protein ACRD1K_11340 [Acidimicrobiales bacterium]
MGAALMPVTYLDVSAIVKLAVAEPGSQMLRRHLRRCRPDRPPSLPGAPFLLTSNWHG